MESVRTRAGNIQANETLTYDGLGRINVKSYSHSGNSGSFKNDIYYGYQTTWVDGEYKTSGLVSYYTSVVNQTQINEYSYAYDAENRIANVYRIERDDYIYYKYDKIGQLIEVRDELEGLLYTYTYDASGNIKSKKLNLYFDGFVGALVTSDTYTYGDTYWKDLLTSYNGVTITYDDIGNPLSYYNGTSYTFTWSGRDLVGAIYNSNTYSFTYDENGYRTSKTKNGVTTNYYYDGGKLLAEETSGNVTVYLYDASGAPLGMQYRTANTAS